jgi:hypothetical protein
MTPEQILKIEKSIENLKSKKSVNLFSSTRY